MRFATILIAIALPVFYSAVCRAQDIHPLSQNSDSVRQPHPDSVVKQKPLLKAPHDPHKATIRSALIPGWGQAYNRQYWKIPIVYGALAIPGTLFFYNNSLYHKCQFGYEAKLSGDPAAIAQIDPQVSQLDVAALQNYRNIFRRNRDYSVLYFLLVWGLNVADATVFGHLRNFDVSNDLSMHVEPRYEPLTRSAGVGLVFNFKK